MFNFMKKKTTKTETPQQQAERDSAVDKVLLGYEIGAVSIATMVTGLERDGEALTLDLRLPKDSNPEVIQQELGQLLHPHGITTIHMNVRLPAPEKGSGSSLPKQMPKTTNAMESQPSSGANNNANSTNAEPPITKAAPTQASLAAHPRIRHIIVVASGKGGVGKSTTTVNIALALQKLGNRVGVLDADIYGPSMPTMLGVADVKPQLENEQFVPVDAHGMAMLSIGSLLDGDNTPVAWRGPKATGALMQLYNQTNWPQLDYLVIDMPPGTGDIQLTLAQRIPVTGAVIVTTPQHVALLDAQKGVEMFNKTNIPVLGVVENMALHTCSNCNHTEAIFGTGGGEKIAEQYQVPLLGQLPLASGIRAQVDKGVPSVLANDEFAIYYLSIATNIEANINKFAKPVDDKRIF
ncbi:MULTISPECIES: iron-sulfur cluster carrier protein ApbC [Psychrobacter]|uniref:iron-sulfur cluster carrier protein ApbC n=1 Tax=Psychrobacter TaxID=497 RepID=UPI00086D33DF|nr:MULTISPECIES: iron-sulfur cluster carrier protein ApbC [Psychrobacter]MBA6245421.1 iron-sulfur cluster carrier protein ApbC [Psychrobacter sp. Urea-trap-18]MBA6284969.1 iron-sulfur cluster carrier protein ApbC [Psychrobacter sp. Urea-trap-16]MBA6318818.1 iron-sulfur cluster carrier protein ApbC [Psychrobacter sp. Urea-trap-20]MBA6333103.1 iron-sulfur cluster carrier protein ApbC [Psychrobacter sp. Urea-trap-19]OEH69121.1 MAG: ATP-binding protein [Psychrobacter sp. B29-1]|tara:strand:+ start:245 stop:1468 length:1224 start_codon:yes stop_codon:yes gene_type:complete